MIPDVVSAMHGRAGMRLSQGFRIADHNDGDTARRATRGQDRGPIVVLKPLSAPGLGRGGSQLIDALTREFLDRPDVVAGLQKKAIRSERVKEIIRRHGVVSEEWEAFVRSITHDGAGD